MRLIQGLLIPTVSMSILALSYRLRLNLHMVSSLPPYARVENLIQEQLWKISRLHTLEKAQNGPSCKNTIALLGDYSGKCIFKI